MIADVVAQGDYNPYPSEKKKPGDSRKNPSGNGFNIILDAVQSRSGQISH